MANARTVAILGSTSAIARAVAVAFGRQGYSVILAARDPEENETVAADVRARCGVEAHAVPLEAEDFESHAEFLEKCLDLAGDSLEGVVLCFGYMENQATAQSDFRVARRIVDVNYTATISLLERFAGYFEQRKSGFIAGVSSVAGDRGRQSNYIYGSSKAGMTTYLEGLRNRLYHAGVHVTTIKPGFVDTKMTFGLPGLFLVASPEKAGQDILRAIRKRKNVAYVPWFWRYIMFIFQHVPEFIFKRTKI